MDIESFVEDLNGKISDLGFSLAKPLTIDNVSEESGPVAELFEVLRLEIAAAHKALKYEDVHWIPGDGILGFAKAVQYPYSRTELPLVIDYLVSELQALRVILSHSHSVKQHTKPLELSLTSELHILCKLLAVPTSEEALKSHPQRALAQIKAKVAKLLERLPEDQLKTSVPLLDGNLSNTRIMELLTQINDVLRADYAVRREMLIKRVDVTVQSFLWSHRAEGREGEIMSTISHRRRGLSSAPASIRPEDAFTAGPELAAVLSQRVTDQSTHSLRHSSVKAVLIGAVPDRGGRVAEMKLSNRDLMPEWQPRKADSQGRAGSAAASTGSGREIRYGKEHDSRARELLAEAAMYEGEAKTAAEDMEGDEDAEPVPTNLNAATRSHRGRGQRGKHNRARGGAGTT